MNNNNSSLGEILILALTGGAFFGSLIALLLLLKPMLYLGAILGVASLIGAIMFLGKMSKSKALRNYVKKNTPVKKKEETYSEFQKDYYKKLTRMVRIFCERDQRCVLLFPFSFLVEVSENSAGEPIFEEKDPAFTPVVNNASVSAINRAVAILGIPSDTDVISLRELDYYLRKWLSQHDVDAKKAGLLDLYHLVKKLTETK